MPSVIRDADQSLHIVFHSSDLVSMHHDDLQSITRLVRDWPHDASLATSADDPPSSVDQQPNSTHSYQGTLARTIASANREYALMVAERERQAATARHDQYRRLTAFWTWFFAEFPEIDDITWVQSETRSGFAMINLWINQQSEFQMLVSDTFAAARRQVREAFTQSRDYLAGLSGENHGAGVVRITREGDGFVCETF